MFTTIFAYDIFLKLTTKTHLEGETSQEVAFFF